VENIFTFSNILFKETQWSHPLTLQVVFIYRIVQYFFDEIYIKVCLHLNLHVEFHTCPNNCCIRQTEYLVNTRSI